MSLFKYSPGKINQADAARCFLFGFRVIARSIILLFRLKGLMHLEASCQDKLSRFGAK